MDYTLLEKAMALYEQETTTTTTTTTVYTRLSS